MGSLFCHNTETMKDLLKLLSILQLTKEQPITGYIVAGIKNQELPNLANHHYNCTLMAYFLSQKIKDAGVRINERKLLLLVMFHDLSELFGGDIAAPLNRKYKDLKEHKDKIGDRAIDMLSEFMDDNPTNEIKTLYEEFEHGDSDEKWVAKIIDQMEHMLFFEHHNNYQKFKNSVETYRDKFLEDHIFSLVEKIKNPKTKKVMADFLIEFEKNFYNQGWQPISFLMD